MKKEGNMDTHISLAPPKHRIVTAILIGGFALKTTTCHWGSSHACG